MKRTNNTTNKRNTGWCIIHFDGKYVGRSSRVFETKSQAANYLEKTCNYEPTCNNTWNDKCFTHCKCSIIRNDSAAITEAIWKYQNETN